MLRADTVAPERIEVISVDPPQRDSEHALVRVERVGVCGSDIHLFHGTHPYGSYPTTQGHEVVGVVEYLPESHPASLTVGARVVIEPFVACGTCHSCRIGKRNCCENLKVMGAHMPGALAEIISVLPSQLYPTDLEPDLAVLVEPVTIGSQAIHRARVEKGQTVVVFGAGLVGLGAMFAALDAGATVIVADTVASRLATAHELGAAATVDSSKGTVAADLAAAAPDGVDVIVEATGVPAVFESALDLVSAGGTVVVAGISEAAVSFPMIVLTRKELTILGSRNSLDLFPESERRVAAHADGLRRYLRTKTFPLTETAEAMVYAHERRADVEKVIITMSKENE